jgi:hypothetical protein
VTVQVWDLQPRPGATPGRRPMHPSCSSSSEDDDEGQADADCVANLNFNGKTTGFVVDESDGKGERATFAITVSQRARCVGFRIAVNLGLIKSAQGAATAATPSSPNSTERLLSCSCHTFAQVLF